MTSPTDSAADPIATSMDVAGSELTAALRTFLTRVVRVDDVHPHLRPVTLGGGDLATFAPLGPDTFCYFLLPPPGRDDLTIDRRFTWEQHAEMAPAHQPVGAYYTVRRWRPEVAELEFLIVLHDDAASGASPVSGLTRRVLASCPQLTGERAPLANRTGHPRLFIGPPRARGR